MCKVTFELPKGVVSCAKRVYVVGEFNRWNMESTPMKRLRDGSFSVTLDLEKDKEYQYRYLIDGTQWENDINADNYVPSPYGDCENSVVVV